MSVEVRDESGIRIRLGHDPKMVMEDAPSGDAPTGDAPVGDAPVAPEIPNAPSDPEVPAAPENDPNEDYSNWTLEDAVKKVKETRQEAAKYRTRAQKFESTFSDLDDATTEGLLGLVAALKTGDPAAVPVLQSILADLSPEDAEKLIEEITEPEAPKALTPEEVEKLIMEREQAKELEQAQKEQFDALKAEISELGYTIDGDPNAEATLLFFFAQQQPQDKAPDFKAAHEKVEEFRQAIIDGYKDGVRLTNSVYAKTPVTGATPTGGGRPKNTKEAKAALESFLNS